MKQIYIEKDSQGWTYYIDSRFAWIPTYCQGTFVWLRRVWFTWPEKDGKPICVRDVLPENEWYGKADEQMDLTEFPYDPRAS